MRPLRHNPSQGKNVSQMAKTGCLQCPPPNFLSIFSLLVTRSGWSVTRFFLRLGVLALVQRSFQSVTRLQLSLATLARRGCGKV